jgi:hypothetical protein
MYKPPPPLVFVPLFWPFFETAELKQQPVEGI